MIKYFIRLGEEMLDRWGDNYIVYSTKSENELLDDGRFLEAVHEALCDLYYEYGEDDELQEDFVNEGAVNQIRLFDETSDDPNLDTLYDER